MWLPALLLAAALGGCSSAGSPSPAWQASVTPASMAGVAVFDTAVAAPPPRRGPYVEVEEDGIEGQRPPRRRGEPVPDDPAEPFSPNYGSVPQAADTVPAPV